MAETTYVLDANVFIQSARNHYAFDIAPKFWEALIQHANGGRIQSIDRIKAELDRGKDRLTEWAAKEFGHAFASTDQAAVIEAFGRLMNWVQGQAQYKDEAKAEFATVADGWLIAYAMAFGKTVVTHEQPDPQIKRKVPIPNVCQTFGVPFINSFELLRQLGVRFE